MPVNRAARRRAARIERKPAAGRYRPTAWRRSTIAFVAAAVLGAGLVGPHGAALAEQPVAGGGLADIDLNQVVGMLDDDMISGFVEMCRTGALAGGNPNAGRGTDWDPNDVQSGQAPPGAIVSCTDSTGTGMAIVLPERFEIGQLAQNLKIDTGPDQNILGIVKFKMGERNLFEIVSGLLFDAPKIAGIVSVRDQAKSQFGISIDPRMFDAFKSYAEVAEAANIKEDRRSKDVCINEFGKYLADANSLFGCTFVGGSKVAKGQDINNLRRNQARQVLEYLAGPGVSFPRNSSTPIDIPPIPELKGQSTIKGAGINLALSMRDGRALAETGNDLAVALAGADHGRLSAAYAKYAVAIAANMDTDDIRFTWFGKDVDFGKLLAAGLLDSDLAKDAGADDMKPMLEMIGGLNGTIPGLKEVFCFGVDAKASAEGLGSCTNFLGTFDTYQDLRALTNGSKDFTGDSVSRQQQYGLTDATSLLFGNGALLQQFLPLLAGGSDADLSGLLSNPAVAKLLVGLISEDHRIKITKDFFRYTKNVETVFAKEPVFEADGVTPKTEQAKDSAGRPIWSDAEGTHYSEDGEGRTKVMVPVMKNKVTPRMVGVTEDAWEEYVSDVPVTEDAKDADGKQIWIDAAGAEVDEGTAGAVKKQSPKLDAEGKPIYQSKTRYFKKPVMVDATDADGKVIWVDASGTVVPEGTEGATKKSVQKTEQAKNGKGELLWDPVIEKTTTAHWLTSDYGLREPVVIQWLGHEVVLFPAVEVNNTYRPNLMGVPQIRKIADGAQAGLLPKVSLVQWDNPFGLGTWNLANPFDPLATFKDFTSSITLDDDLKAIDKAFGITDGIKADIDARWQELEDWVADAPNQLKKSVEDFLARFGPEATTPESPVEDAGDGGAETDGTTTAPRAGIDAARNDSAGADTTIDTAPGGQTPETSAPSVGDDDKGDGDDKGDDARAKPGDTDAAVSPGADGAPQPSVPEPSASTPAPSESDVAEAPDSDADSPDSSSNTSGELVGANG